MSNKYYAVTGRIPDDDGDSCYCMEATSPTHAVQIFNANLLEDADMTRGDCIKQRGMPPIVCLVLASDTPITVNDQLSE